MKIAVIGSRCIKEVNLSDFIPPECDEIVSGGAVGVDSCASAYARAHGLKLTEFLPKYEQFGRAAPIFRNYEIVDYADEVFAFWDGASRGTKSVIDYSKKTGKRCRIFLKK